MALIMDTSEIPCDPSMVDENGNGLPWGLTDPNGLVDVLKKKCDKVLVIDSRSFLEFNTSHIQQSVNVCCSKLVKRRLQQNKVRVQDLLSQTCHVDIDESWNVIVYDQCTEDPSLLTEDNFVYVLLCKLALVFNSVTFLKGGFLAFQAMHPPLCESKSSCIYKCAPLTSLSQPCLPVSNVGPTRILPFLYLGSQRDALSQETIQVNGINYIINLSTNCGQPPFVQDGHFLRIPVNDNFSEKLLPYFYKAFRFIDKVREANGCVLVHCLAGISRSPTLAIAYIMNHMKMSSDDAYRYVKDKRPTISPNFNFLGQLLDFEKQLRQEMTEKISPAGVSKVNEHRPTPFVMDLQLCSPSSPVTRGFNKYPLESGFPSGFPCGESTITPVKDLPIIVSPDPETTKMAAVSEENSRSTESISIDKAYSDIEQLFRERIGENVRESSQSTNQTVTESCRSHPLAMDISAPYSDTNIVRLRKKNRVVSVMQESSRTETVCKREHFMRRDPMVMESVRSLRRTFSLNLSPVFSPPSFPSTPVSPQTRPTSIENQSSPMKCQPSSTESRPVSIDSGMLSMESEPMSLESQPMSLESQPVSSEKRPFSLESRTVSTEKRPLSLESQTISLKRRPFSLESRNISIETGPLSLGSPMETRTISMESPIISMESRPVSMDSMRVLQSPIKRTSTPCRPTSLEGLSLPSSENTTPSTPSKPFSLLGISSSSSESTSTPLSKSKHLRLPGSSPSGLSLFGLQSPTSAMAKLNFSQTLFEQMESVTVENQLQLHNFPATSLDKLSFTPCLASDESPLKPKVGATKRPISTASIDSKSSSEPISPMSISSISSGSSGASVPSPVNTKVVLRSKKSSSRSSTSTTSSPISETKSIEPSSPMSYTSSSSGSSLTSPTATTSKVVLRSRDNKAKRPMVRPNSIAFSTYPTFDLGSDSQDSPTSGSASQDDASEAYMLQNSKKSKQESDDSSTSEEKKFRWGKYSEREIYKQITAAMNSAMLRTRVYEASRRARSLDDILSSEEGPSGSDCDCTMFGKIPRRCSPNDNRFTSPASIFDHLPCRCRGSSDPYQSNSSISSSGSHSSLHGSLEVIQLSNLAPSRNPQSRKRLPHR